MKKLFFILMLLIFTVPAWAEKQDISELDGNEWRTRGSIHRGAFISGFILGSDYTVKENLQKLPDDFNPKEAFITELELKILTMKDEDKITAKEALLAIQERRANSTAISIYFSNYKLSAYYMGGITVGQIVDGLNILYEDFKNRSIKIKDAIYVVKRQIKGTVPEDIEKILLYLRSGKTDYEQLVVKDEKGNIVRHITFP